MAKPVLRPDAKPIKVYNEALCVYLYDEAHADTLRQLMSDAAYPGVDPAKSFFENLSVPAFGAAVAERGLAVSYLLEQDDPIVAEVIVGPPLTEDELSIGAWHEPQRVLLDLPSGRLCVESANTVPLEQSRKEDKGVRVEVPPGKYVLTLYRVNDGQLRGKKYRGPDEVIVLTPQVAASPPLNGPILKVPVVDELSKVVGAYTTDGRTFQGQMFCGYFWDPVVLNLDRSAIERLGLKDGTLIRVTLEKMVFTAIYLGDLKPAEANKVWPKEKLDAFAKKNKEVGFALWTERRTRIESPVHLCLAIHRYEGKKAMPTRLHGHWVPIAGEMLAETFE